MSGYIRYFKTILEAEEFVELLEAMEKWKRSASKPPVIEYGIRVETDNLNLAEGLKYLGAVAERVLELRGVVKQRVTPEGEEVEVEMGLPIDEDNLLLVGKYSVLDMQVPDRDRWYRKWLRGKRRVIEVTQKGDLDDEWCWRVRVHDGSDPNGDVFVEGMWLRTVEELQVIERVFGGGEG